MKPGELFAEAIASARSRAVPTAMVALLAAAMCLTTLLTVGRTASVDAQIQERIDAAGARSIGITDTRGLGLLSESAVVTIANLSVVESAYGLTVAVDATNLGQGTGGAKAPLWHLTGDVLTAVRITSGRAPRPGEAVVSEGAASTLGFAGPAGAVESGVNEWPVVGTFVATSAGARLDAGIVVASDGSAQIQRLTVVAESAGVTDEALARALQIISPPELSDLSIESPTTLAQLQQQIAGDVGTFGRYLLFLVLGGGAALSAVVVLADVLIRRSEIGRRRALGMRRSDLVVLVAARTGMAAVVGAIAGMVVGSAIAVASSAIPPPDFIVATGVLAVLATVVAAIPPGLAAARLDPVKVLRTP